MTSSIHGLGFTLFLSAFVLAGCAADAEAVDEDVDSTEEALVETNANLLANGGFKTSDDWREILKWTKNVGAGGGEALVCVYTPGGTNGYLCLNGGKNEASKVWQTVAAEARQEYLLTFKAATDSPNGIDPDQQVKLEFLDSSKRVLKDEMQKVQVDRTPDEGEPGTGAWWRPFKKNKLAATAPAKTAFVRVTFIGKADPPREYGRPIYAAYESVILKRR